MLRKLAAIGRCIGGTPLVELEVENINLYAKLEFNNFVGSIKDRAAFSAIRCAVERDEINQETIILESSSGNFALALAAICRALGLQFIPVIDNNINPAYERLLEFLCQRIVKIVERDTSGGYLLNRLRAIDNLRKETPNNFWTQQYSNPDIAQCHYDGVGAELSASLDSIDYAFIAVSTGGTVAGISRRLKEAFRKVKVIAVDVEGSVIFGGPPKKRFIPGMGAAIVPDLIRQAQIDEVLHVSEANSIQGCHELFLRHGIFAGGSSGAVFFAINEYFKQLHLAHKPTVVFICADRGTAYADNVYNHDWIAWFQQQMLDSDKATAAPSKIPARSLVS